VKGDGKVEFSIQYGVHPWLHSVFLQSKEACISDQSARMIIYVDLASPDGVLQVSTLRLKGIWQTIYEYSTVEYCTGRGEKETPPQHSCDAVD